MAHVGSFRPATLLLSNSPSRMPLLFFSSRHKSSMVFSKNQQHSSGVPANQPDITAGQPWQLQPRHTSSIPTAAKFSTSPAARLSQISRHLNQPSSLRLDAPYSSERAYSVDTFPKRTFSSNTIQNQAAAPPPEMSASTQAPHPTILIPGPVEFDDGVLQSMSHYSESHVGMPFVKTFGETLTMLRSLFQTKAPGSQPFVISGSGTLGWDQVASNLAEPGEDVLVLHTGYFGDSFADCFETYGAKATQLKAEIGDRPQLPEIEKALKEKKYKILTITHVDTSTGVLSQIEAVAKMARKVSPETLIVIDGVCSVGAEEIRFDDWDLDVVMTASQKAIGCPAGLSILMVSGRAIEVFNTRKSKPASYFASWKNWLPIMQNYEAKKPSYFATPSPQLIHALHTALTQLLSQPLDARFARHRAVSKHIKDHVSSLGLTQLASKPENQSCAMTAMYLPEGVTAAEFLPGLLERGVVFAGGLHKQIASRYIRFGHMGVSVIGGKRDHIEKALEALDERLAEVGYKKP